MQVGDKINFGAYIWRVLDIQDNAALILTEDIIEQRPYHDVTESTTWAKCELPRYLNGEFYERFSEADKARIITVTNQNLDNQWYGTDGGEDTIDRIFLLSIEEVACKYFGDSSERLYNRGKNQDYWFQKKDVNNSKRAATFKGDGWWWWWWWLRSPGRVSKKTFLESPGCMSMGAVYIHGDGNIGIQGNRVLKCNNNIIHRFGDNTGGVRPALWLSLE